MNTSISLKSVFSSKKEELTRKLSGISLPKDAQRVQAIVADYLNDLFQSEGVYRQHLTQSEDYILQAAMSLLSAQQSIAKELTQIIPENKVKIATTISGVTEVKTPILQKEQCPIALGGTVLGGAAGALIGTWAAVFGSIAGTAIALYFTTQQNQKLPAKVTQKATDETSPIKEKPINVDVFANIIENICQSVDALIGTFRAQVNRVVQKYESQEKPTLDKEYRVLLESIQSLVGYKRNHNAAEEKYTKKIQDRIEDLAESLDNYNITLVNYSEDKSLWFDKVSSPNTTELKEVFPAIVKDKDLIIPGKVFIPS